MSEEKREKKRRFCDKGSIRLGGGSQDKGSKLRNEIGPSWCSPNTMRRHS